jgi:dienelactone hydrolase
VKWIVAIAIALMLAGCASPSTAPQPEQSVMGHVAEAGLIDRRGRFREIFCQVLERSGDSLPDYRPCDEALSLVDEEAGATGLPVDLTPVDSEMLVLFVPGLGWDCFADWLDLEGSSLTHVATQGFEVSGLIVDALSSTAHNAQMIRDYVAALPPEYDNRPIVLVGYSKGAPDILQAVVDYPQLAERVVAVVSMAGSIGGSPLADLASQNQANLLTLVPGAECDRGDEGAVDSLRTQVRADWLASNPLPSSIRYYSLITYPHPDRVSWGLEKSYRILNNVGALNDTQVLLQHQMIPGSNLLAFLNADHWAIAVPVSRGHPFVADLFVDKNDYPREAFLEAVLRFLQEDLAVPAAGP